jgi:hypothetical protein
MNHNGTALLAVDPRHCNDAVYQKTVGLNDFYFDDSAGAKPLGNMQLLGKITAPILKASLPFVPETALRWLARHSFDWYLMSEHLPQPDSRVTIDGPTSSCIGSAQTRLRTDAWLPRRAMCSGRQAILL